MNWKWWNRFTKLFRPRVTTLVGIDFSQGAVRVAEISRSGDVPYLRNLAMVPVPTAASLNSPEETEEPEPAMNMAALKETLAKALAVSGIRSKYAVLAVDGLHSFMREITFPRLLPEELAEAIKWDIPKYVPYEAESYEFDYVVTGQEAETGDLRVLIVAAPKAIVKELGEIVKEAGLIPLAVDIEAMSVYRTMNSAENSLVLDIGTVHTQITLYQEGNPVFNRVVQGGCPVGTADQEAPMGNLDAMLTELAQEVQRTVQFFTQQHKRIIIDKIIVTGAKELEQIVSLLKMKVDLPVTGHNPLAGLALHPSIAAAYVQDVGPQFAVAVGLAMREDEL